ncbi:MAG: MCE family protein [Firmicutes bacterium]|nr:MCE family protein [Bacillota bacterium]
MVINSPETKVGLFTLAALFILGGVFFWLNGLELFQPGYELEAVFDRIEDLRPGAPVKLQGVDVGRISRIYFENYKVIVEMRIRPQFEIPRNVVAIIATAGVVGDKYLELILLEPGETPGDETRIKGKNPHTMDQFYETASEVINSIKQIAKSVEALTADREMHRHLKSSLARFDRISKNLESITGSPEMLQIIQKAALAMEQLNRATIIANRFLEQIEANGETAADIKETLANAEKISANLDQFTALMVKNGPELELLIKDARQTLQTINQAVIKINEALEGLSGTEDPSQVKQSIKAAVEAAGKISKYVEAFEEFKIENKVGAGRRDPTGLIVNYQMDINLNRERKLLLGVEDIGAANLASLQVGLKYPSALGRFGLYRNEVGLGLDYLPTPNLTLGVDLWDTESTNIGLSSSYQFNEDWAVKFSASQNFDTTDRTWAVECWRKF